MKKKLTFAAILCTALMLFIISAFTQHQETNKSPISRTGDKEFCFEIRCTGKQWWKERTPKLPSSNQAYDYMKKKYPDCSVSMMSDEACD
jgi:hypothetical protein